MLLCTGGGEFLMDGGTCMLSCECRVMHLVRRGLGYVLQGLAYFAFVLVDVQVSPQAAVETAGRTWVSTPAQNLYLPVCGLRSRVVCAVPCILGSHGLLYVVSS